jgi:phosphoribosylaminoimidazolecarboxamide formyltransferase/IMP cyclohydrolase
MSREKETIGKSARRQYSTKVKEDFPELIEIAGQKFLKRLPMRYGENPGTPAAFYIEERAAGPNMATMRVLQEGAKGLGYINVGDMDLGQRLVKKLTDVFPRRAVAVLVKHEMPSGVALAEDPVSAFEKAWNADPISNFGSVDVFNFSVSVGLARLLVESPRNVEVVYAPDFEAEALDILATRKTLRVVKMGAPLDEPAVDNGLEFKRVAGGLLVQKRFDSKIVSPDAVEAVSARRPSAEEIQAAILNWNVAAFTRSNAVVIGKTDKVHGIGSGQRSRIDAAEDAIRISRRGYGPEGCVLASDAFMPFPDVVELAAQNGITAIIYPLGSVRDEEVIDRANGLGLALIVTRKPGETDCERCFLHR